MLAPESHARLRGGEAGGLFLPHPIPNRHLHICVGGSTVPRKLALGVCGRQTGLKVVRLNFLKAAIRGP